jgi:hypothetical protein
MDRPIQETTAKCDQKVFADQKQQHRGCNLGVCVDRAQSFGWSIE